MPQTYIEPSIIKLPGSFGSIMDPDFSDAFVCCMAGDRLLCNNGRTQQEVSIVVGNIVCILPAPTDYEYIVIFSEKHTDLDTTGDYAHINRIKTNSLPSALLSQYLCTEIPHHLASVSDQDVNIHVVISTCSGTGKAKKTFQNAVQPFLSYVGLARYEVHETQSAQTIAELARSKFVPCAKVGIRQTIILLSGDGGLVDIVGAFYNTTEKIVVPPCIALIPTGTGNAMANSTGLLHPIKALATLLQGQPRHIPVFVSSFSPKARYITDEGRGRATICSDAAGETRGQKVFGAVVASWGVHAALVADSDTAEYRHFGVDRFKMAAKELLSPSDGSSTHKYRGKISLAKQNGVSANPPTIHCMEHDEHMYVLTTLVSRLERDFTISPDSLPLDDRLRFVHFGPVPPNEAMRLMGKAYQGGLHVHENVVTYTEVERLRIDFAEAEERWRRVCVDGKIISVEQGGWMEVCKEPRRLLNLIVDNP